MYLVEVEAGEEAIETARCHLVTDLSTWPAAKMLKVEGWSKVCASVVTSTKLESALDPREAYDSR